MRRSVVAAAVWASAVVSAADVKAEDAPVAVSGTIGIARLVERLPPGEVYAVLQRGLGCRTVQSLTADGSGAVVSDASFPSILRKGLLDAGLRLADNKVDVFETTRGKPDFELGGMVRSYRYEACVGTSGVRVTARMEIEWQVRSTADGTVVMRIDTTGSGHERDRGEGSGGVRSAVDAAFTENVRDLVDSSRLRAAVKMTAPAPAKPEDLRPPVDQPRIVVAGVTNAAATLADAVDSVVLIVTSKGFGSGVLVSTDGYILTDAHVVEANKLVKIRWSDGFEADGQVVRLHARRDVALIKTDPHGHTPLPVRTGQAHVGDTVTAIGAPLERELQGTVTRGIVSANRYKDGFAFIQSDVAVNHGNSGGPLLDEKGNVIGLTDLSLQPIDNVQVGINYFTPIKDALDFLSVDIVAPAASSVPVGPSVRRAAAPRTVKKALGAKP